MGLPIIQRHLLGHGGWRMLRLVSFSYGSTPFTPVSADHLYIYIYIYIITCGCRDGVGMSLEYRVYLLRSLPRRPGLCTPYGVDAIEFRFHD
jgi:hypothetical protein